MTLNFFCSLVASTRWVRSTLSSLCLLSSNQSRRQISSLCSEPSEPRSQGNRLKPFFIFRCFFFLDRSRRESFAKTGRVEDRLRNRSVSWTLVALYDKSIDVRSKCSISIRCQQNMYGLMASPNRSVGLSHFPLLGYCDKYLKNDAFPTYVVRAVPRRKSQC